MAKRTIKISIKLPKGVTANEELVEIATKAANDAVSDAVGDLLETQRVADDLAAKGIHISAEELLKHKSGGRSKKTAAKKTGARKRVVLSETDRKNLIADLKAGLKIKDAAEKYGVSGATVMNVKTKAGLTNKRK